jgi:hypothetical protein
MTAYLTSVHAFFLTTIVGLHELQTTTDYLQMHFLSFSLSIGWRLSIWKCCKLFFSLLYNCQLLCFWRLALSIVVEVFPRPFFRILLLQGFHYKLVMPNCMPYPNMASVFLEFVKSKLSSFAL